MFNMLVFEGAPYLLRLESLSSCTYFADGKPEQTRSGFYFFGLLLFDLPVVCDMIGVGGEDM